MVNPNYIIGHVRKVLKDAGLYRPEVNYQIEMLANDLIIYRKLAKEAAEIKSAIIEETTRDGKRKKPHPIFAMVQAQANQLRQDLKALLMNYDKTDNKGKGQQKEDNALADFMKSIQDDEEE